MTDRTLFPSATTTSLGRHPLPVIDRPAVAAAGLFADLFGVGRGHLASAGYPGEPLGIRVPGTVATHLAIGWGSALSAPAPMQVAALAAAFSARPGLTWPARTLTGIGVAGLAGILAEPVTWGRRPRSWAVAAHAAPGTRLRRRTDLGRAQNGQADEVSELLCASPLRSVAWRSNPLCRREPTIGRRRSGAIGRHETPNLAPSRHSSWP